MNLLIVTQVVDTEHVILGFFCRWIEEFARQCDHVHVVCLQEGRHNLPANVTVHSLGKEHGASRIAYVWRFYKYVWQLRHQYDNVFVHMNQIYVILGALLWRAWGKQIGLWYTHGTVSWTLRLAEKCTHRIFTASAEGCQMQSDKIIITGHGIDVHHFAPDLSAKKDIDLITVGRITESKNLLQLIDILANIRQAQDMSLTIVGAPVTDTEKQYEQTLRTHIGNHKLADQVHFIGRVSQADLPGVLNRAKVFVTVAQNGSLDKVVLEAMACGLAVVSMAPGNRSLPLDKDQVTSDDFFSNRVMNHVTNYNFVNKSYVEYVVATHSLQALVVQLINQYE